MFWRLNWQGMRARIEQLKNGAQVDVLIGCVETLKARPSINRWPLRSRVLYWLDLGNKHRQWPVRPGAAQQLSQSKKKKPLPTVSELYPEIVSVKGREDDQPSCSATEALTRQDPFIAQR